ncbi:MAG: cyclic nucleotide-binding domain-containing protein, partial [Betaproteobacteria bacterium]
MQRGLVATLADARDSKRIAAGAVLFEMGDPGATMFVVKSGELRIQVGDLVFETVGAGGVVGEMALLDEEA